jgi:hypothetical protein
MAENSLLYPYWNNPQGRNTAQAIASQETRRGSENRTPLRDDFSNQDARFILIPHTFQDSRRAGQGDKQINAVTDRAFLYQRVFDSPALAANRTAEE